MLSVKGVTKTFGEVVAVDDISFDVRQGEVVGVIGPNGSGKSTLFEVISGFYRPNKGEVSLGGRRIDGLSCHRIAQMGMSRSCQKSEYFGAFTIMESMMLPLLCRMSMHAARQRAKDMLQTLGLEAQAEKLTTEVSFADQRMVAIGQALVSGPRMLLLDEPFTGLSAERINLTAQLVLQAQAEGTTTIVIEHRLGPLFGICSRVIVMSSGAKIAEGTPWEVQRDERVLEIYLGRQADA